MSSLAPKLQNILNHLPGPGKLIFGGLTEDPRAFRALAACLLAIIGTYLTPPVMNLGYPPIEQGLRDLSSGTPLTVAAGYLLLAILTLVGGATGDIFGRKRFLIAGLTGILLSQVLGMLWLNTPQYLAADILFKIAQTTIGPMCIAIVTITFAAGVRPFAYGLVFGTQGIALAATPGLYSLLKQVGAGRASFLPAMVLCVVAILFIVRDVHEPRTGGAVPRFELVVNLIWASAIFAAVYGLIISGGGLTSKNAVWTIAVSLLGLIVGFRWLFGRLRKRGVVKLYDVRNLSLAILAGIVLAMAQGTFFYQIWPYFEKVQGVGAVAAGLRIAPFILGMLIGTTVIVRLAMRFDARHLIAGGMLTMAIGMAPLWFMQVDTRYVFFILPFAVMGLGFGIAGPARTVTVLSTPPPSLTGMAAGINAAAGQSGYGLGVIMSSMFVTTLADSAFLAHLNKLNLSAAVMAKVNGAWENAFARAFSGTYTDLPATVTQWITLQFAAAFTTGLGQTLLLMAAVLAGTAVVIYLGMAKGLKGSFIVPPASRQEPD